MRQGTRKREREADIQGARHKRGNPVPRLALPPRPLPCGSSLHPVPSLARTSSRMRSCSRRQWREDGEQGWM